MRLGSQAEMEEGLRGVEGWFSPDEAWALHESIRNLSPERPITVVEIGSSRGRSTIAAGHALLARTKGGTLYAIDPQNDELFEQLRANVAAARVQSVVNLVRATSREARKEFGDRPVDLIFIDGSHEYEDVRDDLRDWLPLVRPGGIVAVNDPFWWGVARALRERLSLRGELRSPRLMQNTLFFSYLPDSRWTRRDGRELLRVRACFLVARGGGSLLALTGASRVLPQRLKRPVLRTMFRLLIRCFSRLLPTANT
jgi:predicted O-methyltransferase YrrM